MKNRVFAGIAVVLAFFAVVGCEMPEEKDTDVKVTGVTLDDTTLTMTVGEEKTLTVTIKPSNATNKSVDWSSSNNDVASVSKGKVTAKTAGTATITVKTKDGGKTTNCLVTVNAAGNKDFSGTITISPTTATVGETLTANYSGSEAVSYQWNKDSSVLTGKTS